MVSRARAHARRRRAVLPGPRHAGDAVPPPKKLAAAWSLVFLPLSDTVEVFVDVFAAASDMLAVEGFVGCFWQIFREELGVRWEGLIAKGRTTLDMVSMDGIS